MRRRPFGCVPDQSQVGVVGHPALQAADVDRAVEGFAVARLHAGRRTDAAAHRGERLGAQQDCQRGFRAATASAPGRIPTTSLPAGQAALQGASCSRYDGVWVLQAPVMRVGG